MTAPHLGPGHSVAGKYTIRGLVGFTGEVATYRAISTQGWECVIRMYDPSVGQRADVMAELDRTRQKVAAMPPGLVVRVLDAGYDAGTGAPYSTTELLESPSLAKLAETGPLSPDVVAIVMRGLATALDAAHAEGLYHHALKPTNIFVGPAPDYAVRITDFDASVIRKTSPTSHDVYSLAAPWWAPEQLQPSAVVGPPADVFASALVAFYALTGRSYWLSCQTHPPDLPNWQLELMGQRVPVSQRARELGSVVNSLFDGVFGRALSVAQADRPSSAMEIANVLAAASSSQHPGSRTVAFPDGFSGLSPDQSDQGGYVATGDDAMGRMPSEAAALPPFPQPVKKRSSSPLLPIIIGVVAAVLVGGGGVAFLFMRSSSPETPTAEVSASATNTGDVATTSAPAPQPAPAATTEPASSPAPSASSSSDTGDESVDVTIRCTPTCDRVEIDGKEQKDGETLSLAPGKHKIRLVKAGHLIQEDEVDVEAGKPLEKDYRLIKIGPAPTSRPKPCGQFLCP